MTRPRPDWFPERWTQLSLPRLDADEEVGATPSWSFAIVTIERTGRVALPKLERTSPALRSVRRGA